MSNTRGRLFAFFRYLANTVTFSFAVSPGPILRSLSSTAKALLNTCKALTSKLRLPVF